MIEMMVRSLKDQSLKTSCGEYWLVNGEVRSVTFKNMAEFEAYRGLGVFMPAPEGAQESKDIPVILPVPMRDGLPTALHDGDQFLELTNDPDVEVESLSGAEEKIEDEEVEDGLEEDMSSWTDDIDRV